MTPIDSARFRNLTIGAIALLPAVLLLAACNGDGYDPGLVRAPDFAGESGRLARPWQFAHHASSDSYTLTLRDGIAAIERVGHEPWARLSQEIDKEALSTIAGSRVAFSVDIRAHLDDSGYGRPIEPTGLMVRVWQEAGGGATLFNAMVGSSRSKIERLELAADARIPEWQRHVLEVQLPQDVSRLEVSAILSTGGRLELRNPSLRAVEN